VSKSELKKVKMVVFCSTGSDDFDILLLWSIDSFDSLVQVSLMRFLSGWVNLRRPFLTYFTSSLSTIKATGIFLYDNDYVPV
jgi:hypothetical protein